MRPTGSGQRWRAMRSPPPPSHRSTSAASVSSCCRPGPAACVGAVLSGSSSARPRCLPFGRCRGRPGRSRCFRAPRCAAVERRRCCPSCARSHRSSRGRRSRPPRSATAPGSSVPPGWGSRWPAGGEAAAIVRAQRDVRRSADARAVGSLYRPCGAGGVLSAALGVALKSNVPGRWQVWQSLRMPGNVTLKNPSVDDAACQLYGHRALGRRRGWRARRRSNPPPSRCWSWFGLWHHEQVVASLRWPAWNASSVKVPSSWWQALQRSSSTIARRPVKPVATIWTLGAITIRPPALRFVCPATGSVTGKSGRLVWVCGCVLVALYE